MKTLKLNRKQIYKYVSCLDAIARGRVVAAYQSVGRRRSGGICYACRRPVLRAADTTTRVRATGSYVVRVGKIVHFYCADKINVTNFELI